MTREIFTEQVIIRTKSEVKKGLALCVICQIVCIKFIKKNPFKLEMDAYLDTFRIWDQESNIKEVHTNEQVQCNICSEVFDVPSML